MKPFDLAAAKAGAKVACGNGMPARILCFDARGYSHKGSLIVALVSDNDGDETPMPFNPDGTCLSRSSEFNLHMAPVVREGWVNVYPASTVGSMGSLWGTREKADKAALESRITCVRIVWTE